MKNLFIIFLFFYTVLLNNVIALTTGMDFLRLNHCARSAGIGNGGVAIIDDTEAIDINIARLSFLNDLEISIGHSELYQNLKYESLIIGLPLRYFYEYPPSIDGIIGINFNYIHLSKFNSYDDWGTIIDTVEYYTYKISLGYSMFLFKNKKFYISSGVLFSTSTENLDNNRYRLIISDIGIATAIFLNKNARYNILGNKINFGVSLNNIMLSPTKNDITTPMLFKFGIGIQLFNLINIEGDIIKYADKETSFGIGLEYWLKDIIALRTGFNPTKYNLNSFTIGVGIKYKFSNNSIIFDYSMLPYQTLGVTHRINVKLRFGKVQKNRRQVADTYYYKGVEYFIQGDYELALILWKKALSIYPEHNKALDRILEVQKLIKLSEKQKQLDKKYIK